MLDDTVNRELLFMKYAGIIGGTFLHIYAVLRRAIRSMLSVNILLKFHSTGSRAITQHGVTRSLDQCTAICKRPPLQLAQLSPAIDSQLAIAAIATDADCGCPAVVVIETVLDRFFYSTSRHM